MKQFSRRKIVIICSMMMSLWWFYPTWFIASGMFASYLIKPFLRAQHAVVARVTSFMQSKKQYGDLVNELEYKQKRIDDLETDVRKFTDLTRYINDIDEIRNFARRYASHAVVCVHIVMKRFDDAQHTLIIDSGSSDGIEVGMVAVYKNSLVGKVSHVYPTFSKVTAITDRCCTISACGEHKSKGLVEGTNSQQLLFNHVSHLDPLKVDEQIISSGQGPIFPRGFVIGTITACSISGVTYEATITPAIDFSVIDYCYILKRIHPALSVWDSAKS